MKTKQIIIMLALLLAALVMRAQSTSEAKLLVKYSEAELADMKATTPQTYELMSFFVNACYVVDMPDKAINYVDLERVDHATGQLTGDKNISLDDLQNFNPLDYNVTFDQKSNTFYKAGNTGKLVIAPAAVDMQNAIKNAKNIQNNYNLN